jgi:hypothetical protein
MNTEGGRETQLRVKMSEVQEREREREANYFDEIWKLASEHRTPSMETGKSLR